MPQKSKSPRGSMIKVLRDRQGLYFDKKLRTWEPIESKSKPYNIYPQVN